MVPSTRLLLLSSLFILLLSSSVNCWDPGHLYLYNYTASIRTGALHGGQHIQLEAGITIRVHPEGSSNNPYILFKVDDARITTKSPDGTIPEEEGRKLEAEFGIRLDENGSTVKSLGYLVADDVRRAGPATDWVINFHRGLVSLINLRHPQEADRNHAQSYIHPAEEEVTGSCHNVYDWSPLQDVGDDEDELHYEAIKTRDFDRCEFPEPMYNVMAPAGWRCRPGSALCENVQSRSLVSRFHLRRTDMELLDIQRMDSREDWISLPWGARHQQSYRKISIVQEMDLIFKRSDTINAWPSVSGIREHSLTYEFQDHSTDDDEKNPQEEDAQVLEGVRQLHAMMFRSEDLIDRKASALRRHLTDRIFPSAGPAALSRWTRKAHQELTPTQWSLFVQLLSSVGSAASLDITKDLMVRRMISVRDAAQILSGFNMFLRDPRDHVLAQLLSLLDVEMVAEEPGLRQTAMVSLASFFRMTRIDRLASETRFPIAQLNMTGQETDWPSRLVSRVSSFLHPDGDNVTAGDRSAALSALNILGHPSLIHAVLPLVEGRGANVNPSVRTKAILTLHKLAHHGDKEAIRILHTVYANPSEDYQVRLGAFTLLMLSCPPDHVWQAVAVRTWFEPNQHVASFVFTTLDTLASFQTPLRFLQKLSLKAKKVLKLAKPVPEESFTKSANYIWSYETRRRVLAAYLRLETFAGKTANHLPKELYGRLNFNLGAVDFDLLEFEVHGHRLESLLSQLIGSPIPPRNQPECSAGGPIKALMDRMNITADRPDEEDTEGFLHWTLMESVENFWSFDNHLAKSVKDLLDSKERTEGSLEDVEWLGQLPLVNVDLRWANSMGLETQARVTGLVSASLNGSVHWNETSIRSGLNPTLSLGIESSVGIQLGNIKEASAVASSDVLLLASIPGHLILSRSPDNLHLDWTPSKGADHHVFLHKSHCSSSSDGQEHQTCPPPESLGGPSWQWEDLLSSSSWSQMGWILRRLSHFWLPDAGASGGELSWSRSAGHPDRIRLSFHHHPHYFGADAGKQEPTMDIVGQDEKHPPEWAMISGTADLVHYDEEQGGGVKRIGLSDAAASGGSSGPAFGGSWIELPWRMIWTLMSEGGNLTIQMGDDDEDPSGRTFPLSPLVTVPQDDDYAAECRIGPEEIVTFDGVSYSRTAALCRHQRYVAVASTGGTSSPVAILVDEKGLELVMAGEDVVRVNLPVPDPRDPAPGSGMMTLAVNQIDIPLSQGGIFTLLSSDAGGRAPSGAIIKDDDEGMSRSCRPTSQQDPRPHLLRARQKEADEEEEGGGRIVELELPRHDLLLDIRQSGEILIKAKRSLSGRVQGLCGDMDGERLYEFRDPSRCILPSGRDMAAAYRLPSSKDDSCEEEIRTRPAGCIRNTSSPTLIRNLML